MRTECYLVVDPATEQNSATVDGAVVLGVRLISVAEA